MAMVAISWITVIWAMVASACLTLATIYFLVWWKNRAAPAHLLFALTAASTTVFTYFELWMMRAQTPAELDSAMRWCQAPLLVWLLSLTWFVWTYLDAGRRWLPWTIFGLRVLFVLPVLLVGMNPNLSEIPSLHQVRLFGETVTVIRGVPNPWGLLGSLTVLLVLVFVADASVTAWRRGDRRKALIVGGSTALFLLTALVTTVLVFWANLQVPQALSLYYLILIAMMGHELSRAPQLVHELQASEAGLREHEAALQASHREIQDLAGRLIASQEVERARIARDLHDDLSQPLAGLSIALSSLKRRVGALPGTGDLHGEVSSLQGRTIALTQNIRHLSRDLHPGVFAHAGLVAALGAYCAELRRRHTVVVTFSAEGDFEPTVTDAALCLYRVAQEALRNVVTHAGACHAEVRLLGLVDRAELTITDDGSGFDIIQTGKRIKGLGLASINERVRLAGGTVSIVTELNKGTRVRVQVPTNAGAASAAGGVSGPCATSA